MVHYPTNNHNYKYDKHLLFTDHRRQVSINYFIFYISVLPNGIYLGMKPMIQCSFEQSLPTGKFTNVPPVPRHQTRSDNMHN